MIFVTVGTQLPFPRLASAMDAFAANAREPVIAQLGPDPQARPHLDRRERLAPAEFDRVFGQARVVVAHAGIGTILSARRLGRPLVLLPRRHALGEHRNDHQMATARQVEELPGIHVAWETDALPGLLGRTLDPAREADSASRAALISRLSAFIAG